MRRLRGIGDLFEETFELYRRHFALVVGVVALLQIPALVFQVVVGVLFAEYVTSVVAGFQFRPGVAAGGGGGLPIASLDLGVAAAVAVLSLIGFALSSVTALGAMAHAVPRLRSGDRPSPGQLISVVLRRFPSLLVLAVLLAVGFGAIAAFFGLALLAGVGPASRDPGGAFTGVLVGILGGLIALIVVLALDVRWSVAVAALENEGRGVAEALRRSWELIRGTMWRTALLIYVTSAAAGVIPTILSLVIAGAVVEMTGRGPEDLVLLSAGIGTVGQLLFAPLVPIAITLLYLDLRDRAAGR